MSFLRELDELPSSEYVEIVKQGNLSDLVQAITGALHNESPDLRPRDTLNNPGALCILDASIEKVLYFGDIHPSKKNVANFEKSIKPFWNELVHGSLAIVLAGDYTHPGEGDLTDMEPSVYLLQEYLLPLKLLFPDQIVLLRGDHESVGSPYAEDFGKGTDFLPSWIVERGLEDLLQSGIIWALGPNKPELGSKPGRYSGIYLNTPESERYIIGGKKFGGKSFLGSLHPFHRIEEKDGKQYLVFRGSEKIASARWIRVEHKDDRVRFYLEDTDRDVLCSIALNQSRTYGQYIEKIGGHDTVQMLQLEFYDRLPLIVSGQCFAGVHAAPPEMAGPPQPETDGGSLSKHDLIELSNPAFRQDNKMAYRRLIFGRPIEGGAFKITPRIVEKFLVTLGNHHRDLFLMAHTRPDHFMDGYRRMHPRQGKELMLNRDIYAPFGLTWNHLVIDSQSPICSHLVIQNRRPETDRNETVHDLFEIRSVPQHPNST